MKMLSLKPHLYAGRRLNTGDEFECRGQSDRRLLIALGRAKDAPVVAALLKATVTAALVSEAPVSKRVDITMLRDAEPMYVEVPADADDVDVVCDPVTGLHEDVREYLEISQRTGKPKRAYKRRDMVAE
jgi:hypothetical protein